MAQKLSETPRLLQVVHLLPALNGDWWEQCEALQRLRRMLEQGGPELERQIEELHVWTGRLAQHVRMARACADIGMRAHGPGPNREELGRDGFGGGD